MNAAEQEKVACRFILTTPTGPGAIALIQLSGRDCDAALAALTGTTDWPVGRLRLTQFGDIDEGLAGRVTDELAQVMPHGGPRVVQRILQRLVEAGITALTEPHPRDVFPEAVDGVESLLLSALARAASPLAIEPLLAQRALWQAAPVISDSDRELSKRLNRLLDPPVVVLAGSPNVGKSTLSNTLLGRSLSIALDMPGTTRDYTAAQIELAGLVVHWHDTPGLRETADPIEARAIELATGLIGRAELLIAMTDAQHDWPNLPRKPDLRIASKADLAKRDDADLNISAATGEGMREFVTLIRDTLVSPQDVKLSHERPWLFDERLLEEKKSDAAGEVVPGSLY